MLRALLRALASARRRFFPPILNTRRINGHHVWFDTIFQLDRQPNGVLVSGFLSRQQFDAGGTIAGVDDLNYSEVLQKWLLEDFLHDYVSLLRDGNWKGLGDLMHSAVHHVNWLDERYDGYARKGA